MFLGQLAGEGTFDPARVRAVENWRLTTNLTLVGAIAGAAAGVLLLFLSDGTVQ